MQLSWWYKQLALSTWFLCNSGAADKCPVHLLTLPHVCLNGAVILFPRYLFSFTAHFARGQFWWISQLNDWQAHEHVYRGNISWCLNFSPWFVKNRTHSGCNLQACLKGFIRILVQRGTLCNEKPAINQCLLKKSALWLFLKSPNGQSFSKEKFACNPMWQVVGMDTM